MGSTFGSYGITNSGMYVSQRGLFVTAHNISNANTPGFSRQQVVISEATPMTYGKWQLGLGADIQQTRQIRNVFLDTMYRDENEKLGYWESKEKTIQDVEAILGEPAGDGLQTVMDQFFQGWEELAKDSGSERHLTVRSLVRQRGIALVDTLNHIGSQLDKLQSDMNEEIKIKIDEINTKATQIAELNSAITKAQASNNDANDYRDQRNVLLDELTKMTNAEVVEHPNGAVSVAIGGLYLVNQERTQKIEATYNAVGSIFYEARWANTGSPVQVTSGTLKGLLEGRGEVEAYDGSVQNGSPEESGDTLAAVNTDADSDAYKFDPSTKNILSEIRKGLNSMVSLLARKLNTIHRSGIAMDKNPGGDFFTRIREELPFEMGNIQVNPELENLNKIVSSLTGEEGNNTVAQQIVDMRYDKFLKTRNLSVNVDDYYRSIITWVGTTGQEAQRITENQNKLVEQIQNKKEAISGVSMDEEMTSMMKYQHAYNASARFVNVVDEMIDAIVNRLGIVGR